MKRTRRDRVEGYLDAIALVLIAEHEFMLKKIPEKHLKAYESEMLRVSAQLADQADAFRYWIDRVFKASEIVNAKGN